MGTVNLNTRFINFINKSKESHTQEYDYSKVEYVNSETEVEIICNIHGSFFQKPGVHVRGSDCPSCSRTLQVKRRSSTEDFIKKANLVHSNFYDYSQTSYTQSREMLKIICPIHGVFSQQANSHLNGFGCMQCGIERTSEGKRKSKEQVLQSFRNVHKDRYDYSKVIYKNNTSKVEIICNTHGSFLQSPKSHISGSNCPNCGVKVSKPEKDILNYIKTLYSGDVLQSYRPSWLDGKELDIFIPELNVAIEYNGTSFHHSSKSEFVNKYYKNKTKHYKYHFNKWNTCRLNGVTLLSIHDFYWMIPKKKEIFYSKIRHLLRLDSKVFARKSKILPIENEIAFKFYENNHIEGKGFPYKNSQSFGLFVNNELLMCSTIGEIFNQKSKTFKQKLHRICTKLDTTVVGGLSKMSKYLRKDFGEFTYQITLSSGGSSLNKSKDFKVIDPRYFWVNPNTYEYFHRNYCQKHLLTKHFKQELLSTDTESTYMERLGFLKVYDNGLAEIII